jgi:hypothetical protein
MGRKLNFRLNSTIYQHSVIAPSRYSLLGDRYTILNCPEIEDHLYKSRAYSSYGMGIGKFKLGVDGYDDTSRFDHSTIKPREFHPIGKLPKVTLIFKRPGSDDEYNFRGLDHTVTFNIKYYSPIQSSKFTKFILNPKYQPNFLKYQQEDTSGDESSDTETT